MDSWHECGSQCESLHCNLIAKILQIVTGAREDECSTAPIGGHSRGTAKTNKLVLIEKDFINYQQFHLEEGPVNQSSTRRSEIRRWSKNWAISRTITIECWLDVSGLLTESKEDSSTLVLQMQSAQTGTLKILSKEWLAREAKGGIMLERWQIRFR